MIHNFVNTVQQDFACLINHFKGSSFQDADENTDQRVNLAAIRMFAFLGLTLSTLIAFKALTVVSVLGLASAAVLYALSRDIFVIAQNQEGSEIEQANLRFANLLNDARNLQNGTHEVIPPYSLYKGTLLRPLWEANFWANQRRRVEDLFVQATQLNEFE